MSTELIVDEKVSLLFGHRNLHCGMPFSTLDSATFQGLFNYASVGILITNHAGEIQMANRYTEQLFGYSESELLGQKVEILIPARHRRTHVHHRENFGANPHSRPMGLGMELSGVKKDKTEFPVEVSLGHYHIGEEHFALAFINDITQRKETEEAIRSLNAHLEEKVKEGSQSLALTVEQLTAQIKETERKDVELQRVNVFLNNIWNHAGAIIIVSDRQGEIQFYNPAAEQALGYSVDEIVNKRSLELFHLPAELETKAAELSLETGVTVAPNFSVIAKLVELNRGNGQEWHYVTKMGEPFFVSLSVTPLRDTQKQVSSYLIIAIDISEKKAAEVELMAALNKEKELNELKSRFVSMASHEFRTPLSAILSSAYLLGKYTDTHEQLQRDKHIKRIVSSVSSLTEILNDFLSVGKIEEGNIHPRLSIYDISRQMDEVILDVQHLLKTGQTIEYGHSGNPAVRADMSMMKHIVTNLLSNAIKFSPEGAVIRLTTFTTEEEFTLSVADSGIGIPVEDQENLFRRFFRSSNVTNIQGTGLGLHIVKKYADLMGGTVTFESELGKGTCFTIKFNHKTDINENNSNN